ncbi:UDP-galactopyranose mutase [Pseudobacteriovorax antillogorgiicola]|uniref:UDP-galactopyranose mutase n=1 Tax=Pseudobacteriovorax antillogorgiicola TaxID=1513793 RepID=A0A1Y6BBA1_9BACT|nr:UDP-galactopyranose mutase [Pseudobacteriovorax antillogorgiicola]SME91754.1 UDP-galactopyranose mutase [Pseudobacteriovorax antillogorgiicola]
MIGAGPAGMTAAYQLCKEGHHVTVYEADNAVGGMAKTIKLWGQKVDLGPHRFFSNEKRINEVWLEVVGRNFSMVDRLTRIYYKKKFFHYPLKPMDALFNLGIFEAMRCVLSYFVYAIFLKVKDPRTFEAWVKGRFGKRLYEIFFKTYSEKLWGIKCDELDADFAAQRIKKLSLFGAVWNALMQGRGNKHKTLVDQFAYPHGGTGAVYEAMADFLRSRDCDVLFETPIRGVHCEGNRVLGVVLQDDHIEPFDEVISTMPLNHLVNSLPNLPQPVAQAVDSLKFRNTLLVFLEVDSQNLFPDNWVYVHSSDLECGRVTNFRNWTKDIVGESTKTILCLEYWANFDESLWQMSNDELINLAKKEILMTGLIGNSVVTNGCVRRIPRSYPIYESGYTKTLSIVVEHLKSIEGLTPIGRYGSFKYNNQDHSILMGILAAENLTKNANYDLWNINTDDDYQEEATITETGLFPGRKFET